jgi:hypothetical protein
MADSLPALFISSLIQIDNRFGCNDTSIRILLDMAAKAMDCDVLVAGVGGTGMICATKAAAAINIAKYPGMA